MQEQHHLSQILNDVKNENIRVVLQRPKTELIIAMHAMNCMQTELCMSWGYVSIFYFNC